MTVRIHDDGGTANGGTDTSAPQTFSITVIPPANDFSIDATPAGRTVAQGTSTTYSVTTALLSGSAETVTLSVTSGLPAGASASFSPPTVSAGGSSTLTVSTADTTPVGGPLTLTIQGAAASATHTKTVSLTVTALGYLRGHLLTGGAHPDLDRRGHRRLLGLELAQGAGGAVHRLLQPRGGLQRPGPPAGHRDRREHHRRQRHLHPAGLPAGLHLTGGGGGHQRRRDPP